MPDASERELVIIGGGPGGYAAAFAAADRGVKVTLIDAAERPGGTCLHVGCIPSKALLHTARVITDAREAATLGLHFEPPRIDLAAVRKRTTQVVDGLSRGLQGLCKRRGVDLLRGRRASFVDAHTVALDDGTRFGFRDCIIATGSVPARPQALALDSPRVMDSTGALRLEDVPASLLVVGGGYIGLELGTVYAALGSKITVVEMTDGLLPGVDRDLVEPLQDRLEGLFDKIHLNTTVLALAETAEGIQATLRGEGVETPQQVFDRVLVAVGRRPYTTGLGL